MWSLATIGGGGGGVVSLNHALIAKLHIFKTIIYIFYYTQFAVLPQ